MLAQPSVPNDTVIPADRIPVTGATPEASFMLLSGQWATAQHRRVGNDVDVRFVHPDTVGHQRLPVEDPQPVQVGDRAEALLFDGLVPLETGFGHMHLEKQAQVIGGRFGGLQGAVAAGVRRMAEDGRCDQRAEVFPVQGILPGVGDVLGGIRHAGGRENR